MSHGNSVDTIAWSFRILSIARQRVGCAFPIRLAKALLQLSHTRSVCRGHSRVLVQMWEVNDASRWLEQCHLLVLELDTAKLTRDVIMWCDFPQVQDHLLAKIPNHPTYQKQEVLHRRFHDTKVKVRDSGSSSTCSASGDRSNCDFWCVGRKLN